MAQYTHAIHGQVTTKTFKVHLNYKVPVEEKRHGLYYINPNLTIENFPELATGELENEAVLVNFGEYLKSEEVLRTLEQMQVRPGTPSELADLHLSNPAPKLEIERCLPVSALGTVWVDLDENRYVPCLHGDASRRRLYLAGVGRSWYRYWWFLTFKKI